MVDYKGPTTTSTATPKKLTFMQKQKKHWLLHLISFCISTIVISMLLTYVAMPKIAQHDMDGSELHLDYQIVSNPTENSVDLKVRNTAVSRSWFTPQLDPFNVSLFLEDTEPDIKPFGILSLPPQHALHYFSTDVNQTMEILDKDQFNEYNKRVTQSKTFRFAMRGKTKLHLGALPVVTVDFNKVIETNGLNSFKGITVSDVNLTLSKFEDGSNTHGTIHIPNPSVMTLQIGDMLQDIYIDGVLVGNTTIKNVVLHPGPNDFPMSSTTDQAKIIPAIQNKYRNGVLAIEARTREITFNGKRLPYFEQAMASTPVFLSLDISDALERMKLGAILDKSAPTVTS